MGFIQPSPPPVDMEEWKKLPHLSRLKPLVQDWGVDGFGTPYVVYLLYIVKLVIYSVGAALVISTTTGLGGLGDFGDWWTEPIVWQKLAVWTLLWEIIGLGCGSMPLTFRFSPMIGGILYWLRPGNGAAAALARQGAIHQGDDAGRSSTSPSTPVSWRAPCICCWPTAKRCQG